DPTHAALAEQAEDPIAIADDRAGLERRSWIGAIFAAKPKASRRPAAGREANALAHGLGELRPATIRRGLIRPFRQPRRRSGARHAPPLAPFVERLGLLQPRRAKERPKARCPRCPARANRW